MRKYAILSKPIKFGDVLVNKLMIYQDSNNVYVFLYDNVDEDSSAYADYCFDGIDSALEFIEEECGGERRATHQY